MCKTSFARGTTVALQEGWFLGKADILATLTEIPTLPEPRTSNLATKLDFNEAIACGWDGTFGFHLQSCPLVRHLLLQCVNAGL